MKDFNITLSNLYPDLSPVIKEEAAFVLAQYNGVTLEGITLGSLRMPLNVPENRVAMREMILYYRKETGTQS